MAEYSTTATTLASVLSAQLGSDVSGEILALLQSGQSGQAPDLMANIVTDYAGGGVPVGTDVVYVSSAISNVGNELANVAAIILPGTGSATVVLNDGVSRVISLGGGGDTVRIAGATNDVVTNVGDRSLIDMGAGFDKVLLAGNLEDYRTELTSTGLVLVHQNGDTIEIHNTEFVQFADGSVIVNAHDIDEATIVKLYGTVLARDGDSGGINYWWNDAGAVHITDIADEFLHSTEFTQVHGDVDGLTNSAFLDILYMNSFGRSMDSSGKAFWEAAMDSGVTKAQIVLHFAQSQEEADLTASKIHIIQDLLH